MKGKLINKIKHIKFLIIPLLIMIMLSSVAYAQYVNTLSESNTGSSKVVDEFTQEFIQIELDEKISLAELEKKFPSQMEVTLDDGSVETVPVTWICESDYENEEYDSYVFEVSLSDGYVMSNTCGSSFIQVVLENNVGTSQLASYNITLLYEDGHTETINASTASELPTPDVNEGYLFDGWYIANKTVGEAPICLDLESYYSDYIWTQDADGVYMSGNQGVHNSTSDVMSYPFTVVEAGVLTFDWKSYGQNYGDYLAYDIYNEGTHTFLSGKALPTYKDGLANFYASNGPDFKTITRDMAPGTYRLVFMYGKNAYTNYNTDTGYVKNIRCTNTATYTASNTLRPDTFTQDITLIEKTVPINYTIKYNGNGNTGGSMTNSSYTYDEEKALTKNGFTKTGHTFSGWNTKADGSGTSYTNSQSVKNLIATSDGTVTLYAQWTINKYYLDINNLVDGEDVLDVSTLNIGSFDLYSYDGVLKFEGIGDHWEEYEYGATYEIKNIKAMTGYTYLGPSSYSGTIGTSDTEIWLEWKTNEYTLTFNGNGGTPSKTSQKIKYKEHCINLATANREGYEFQGWNTKADGTGETITGKTVMGTSDITVYAQWKPNVYINTLAHWLWGFENGEGNNGYHHETDGNIGFNAAFLMIEDSFETAYNTSFEMTKDLAITPPNGTYLLNEFGTYKTNEFSTELDWEVYPFGTKFTQKDELMHFEYDYAPVDYKITYDLDGGTNHNSNPSTYNVLYGVTLQNPTKAGYTFNGWYDSNGNKVTGINEGCNAEFNSTNELFDELAKRATGDIHLTAKWTINSCTATFDANGGTTPSPQTITKNYNEALGTLPTTSRTGYTFNGWYTAKAGGTKISTTTAMLSSNVTYYAQWTANKYALDVNNLVDGVDIQNVLSENIGSFKVYINGVDWWGDIGDYWAEEDYGTPYEVKDIKAMTGYKYVGPSNISGTFDATDNAVWLEWEAIPYTLTFDGNGGTPSETSRTVKYNSAYGILPTASRTGYTFTGWNTKADGSGTAVNASTKMSDTNTTIYAQWTPTVYTNTIEHYAWGFKNSEGNSDTKEAYLLDRTKFNASYGSTFTLENTHAVKVPNGFKLTNVFGTKSIEGTWKTYPIGTSVTQKAESMVFEYDYNIINYSITYNLNGGINNTSNPSKYNVLYGVTLQNPTRAGYKFDGWYNGSVKVTGINEGCNATFSDADELYSELAKRTTGDISLTAKWKVNSYTNTIGHYAIGFKNDEGNNYENTEFSLPQTYFRENYGSSFTMDEMRATTIPNGFHLTDYFGTNSISDGWHHYDMGTIVTQKAEAMEFGYYYKPYDYKITYNLDGGVNNSKNPLYYNVLYGVTLENPTKKGYTFQGWYDNNGNKVTGINEGCNATFESVDELYEQLESRTTGDITLTARWTPKSLTVTFHDNRYSDSEAMVSQTYVYNTGGLFPDLEDEWVKKGYTLIGWSEDKDATTHDYSRMANVSNDWINDNSPSIDLYAVWEANTYTIKYDANGGVGTMEDTDVTYGVPTAIRENAFTKEGYTFAGWYMYIEKEDSWQYHNEDGTVFSWYKKGEEPEGYELTLRVNGDKTSTLVYADGEVVIFVAQWKKLGGYIDGLNGKDTNTGATPSDPVKTLRQAYENLKGVGGTIYVVNTISISQNITLDKNYYEDADGRVELGEGVEVIIKRYSKPTTVNDGFNVDSNYTYMIRTEATGSLTLEDIVIDGHKNAVETGSENEIAGGVQAQRAIIYNTGIINIHNAKIMNNYNAYEHELGGGIRNHGTITMIGGEITGNYAEEGGGIFNRPDSTVTIKGGSISNNTATYGGGILSVSVLNIEGGNITGNTASKGGGVYNWSSDADNVGELTITGGIISGNIAGYGGGIQNNGTMTMTGGIVSDNTSEYGGGVLNVGSVIMEGGSIVENTAVDNSDTDDTGGYGGGIYNGIDATFTMNSGTISSNSSTYCGGGVWSSGTLIMKSETAKISGNTATLKGGGGIFNTGSFELKDGLITGNTANGSSYGGGGIFNVGSVIIEDGEISNNTGDYGGGILNGVQGYEAALIIAGGSINDNTANTIAGGVWNNGTLIMEDGAIYGNEAPNGGGVGNYRTFTMSGGTVSNNTAVDNSETEATEGFGKGIYQNGIMNLSGNGKVSTSNDVYLNTDKFITITGELNYSDTAALITPSDYTLGRTVVRTAYGDALASDVYKQFELTSNGNSVLRPGDYVDDSAGILDTDVIISGQYTIHFDKNLDDEVQNMPADQTAYWYEKVTISNKIPTSADYEFIDWNESQDGTGISWFDKIGTEIVFNRDSNLTLYAQWRLKFTLSADVYKMLMPDGEAETIIFKRGEQGKLEMITTGYVTRIEVEFPTLSQYDSTLNQTHTLEPVYESVTEQYFNIPLYAPNGIYEIKVTAYNDNNTNKDPITVTLKIKVIDGSVLNDYLTILK